MDIQCAKQSWQQIDGDTITWNTVDVPVERQYIRIGRTQERSAPWIIRVMGNVGSIELPIIPNGIEPIFVSDVEYNISVSANYSTTIQQLPYQYEDESYQAISTRIR